MQVQGDDRNKSTSKSSGKRKVHIRYSLIQKQKNYMAKIKLNVITN